METLLRQMQQDFRYYNFRLQPLHALNAISEHEVLKRTFQILVHFNVDLSMELVQQQLAAVLTGTTRMGSPSIGQGCQQGIGPTRALSPF